MKDDELPKRKGKNIEINGKHTNYK